MKKQITLRIDGDVLEWFKAQGKGYQGRMNDALRSHFLLKSGKGYHDVAEYYNEDHSEDEFIDDPEINYANDQFFKPMPKTGKKKHGK